MKKRKNYIVTIIISVAVIAIALIKLGFFTESKINPIYSYTIQKNDDYEVLLKPNKFYSSEKLLPGGYYASNSINAYSIKFKCDFIGDQKTNIKYNYSIFGNLVGNVRNNENKDMEIWSRNFILCDNIYNEQKSVDKISIDEQVNIDYEYYNNLARLYEKEYGIMIDAILKVRFNIAYVTEFNSLDEKIEDFIELDIPITTTVSEVKENYQKVTTNSIIPQIENRKVHKNIFGVVGILFMVGDIVIIVILAIKSKKTPEEIYRGKLKKILKDYRELIVTVKDEPDFNNLKIINVTILDDLIDVAEQTQNNIIFHELTSKKQSNFYVIVNDYVYIYILDYNE